MALSCASMLLALSFVFAAQAFRLKRLSDELVGDEQHVTPQRALHPTRISCGQLQPPSGALAMPLPVECESKDQALYLYGNTVGDACVPQSRPSQRPRSPCQGNGKLSTKRSSVLFDDKTRRFCCLCPPRSVWSTMTQECVCPSIGHVALAAVSGRCPSSADEVLREEARQQAISKKKKSSSRNRFDPDLALDPSLDPSLFAKEPARLNLELATSYCKAHREIDELAPTARYRLAPVRMGMGSEVPGLGFVNGVVVETLHISKLNAEIKLANTPQGIKLSFSPGEEGETLRVGIDKLVLYVDGRAIEVRGEGAGGKYLLELGGTLEGEDFLDDMITYRSSIGVAFKQTFWKMGSMTSNDGLVKLAARVGDTFFRSKIQELVEWLVSDILSRKLFALIGISAQRMALEATHFSGIDVLPMTIKLESNPVKPLAPHMLDLKVTVTQGSLLNLDEGATPEIMAGFAVPEVTASFAAEGDELSFDVLADTTLDTRRLLEEQAELQNSAVLLDAVEGQRYSDILEEQQAAEKAATDKPTAPRADSAYAECQKKKHLSRSHQTWARRLSAGARSVSAGASYVKSWLPSWGAHKVLESTPVDPSKERLAMEEYLLKTWKAQKPNSIGMLSRVPQVGSPYYMMFGLEDIEFVTEGSLKAVVEASGEATLSGTVILSKIDLKGLAIDHIDPLPCHALQACDKEQATWQPYSSVLAHESLSTISVVTPLTISVTAAVKDGAVDLCATVQEQVNLAGNSSWLKTVANQVSYYISLRAHLEDAIQTSLKGLVFAVFSQFHDKGVSGFTLNLNLNSAKAVQIEVDGKGRYSSLGDFQLLAAAAPLEPLPEGGPEEVLPGQGWTALSARLHENASISGAAREKYSVEPRDWLGPAWAYSVSDLAEGFDLKLHLDPSRAESLGRATGSVSLDIPSIIRTYGNDQGSSENGDHAVGLGRAVLLSASKGGSMDYDAVVSCGSIYFAQLSKQGQAGDIVDRADSWLTAEVSGNFLRVGGHSCAQGTAYVVKSRKGNREFKWCVATHSLLDLAIMYELERARLIGEMLAQGPYAASAPWTGFPMKTTPFDWSNHMPLGLCEEEMQRCAAHFPCQGVQFDEDEACEFISFSEIDQLKTIPSATFAYKEWQVGPVQAWGTEA